jgi:phosphohistidine phosphatase
MAVLELYLVRHGLAGQAQASRDDRLRPLTRAGVRRTRAVAKRLLALGLRLDGLLSSPLVRARQTADVLHAVGVAPRPKESALLAPGGDFEEFLTWLARWRRRGHARLGLVGHLPDLGTWAGRFLSGEGRPRLVLKKAGVVGLTLPSRGTPLGRSSLFLLVPPRYLL